MGTAGEESAAPAAKLTPGASRLVEAAVEEQQGARHDRLGVNHWLVAVLERYGPMAESCVRGIDARAVAKAVRERLSSGASGDPLDTDEMVERVARAAAHAGKKQASERDLVEAVLEAAGYTVSPAEGFGVGSPVQVTTEGEATASWVPTAPRPTPTLEQYGTDLTREALHGQLTPVVGREREIEACMRILCRRKKRNPALIGPAGVGKTAIVEGLAQQIVAGTVPPALRGFRIVALQPSNLVAGAGVVGELQQRWQKVVAEAGQPGLILFIDEVHSIIGAGGMPGSSDVGALLKPALARGDIACIGATTDDEYRRFIESDRALERRFAPIAVQELSAEVTLRVLQAHRDALVELRHVAVPDEVLVWLVDFGREFLRSRAFPDKAVDLLEQCVAYAVVHELPEVGVADAEKIAQEMIGMPIDLDERMRALEGRLAESHLLPEDDAEGLLDRLHVTLRGLELRPQRPNAVLLLTGDAASTAEPLAALVAETLFGAAERVVTIDFAPYDDDSDVNSLLGSPPGYIGFGDRLPIHQVAQTPWSVIVCKNVNGCHPEVREVLSQALADGVITQRDGRRIFLSDAVVLLTAPSELAGHHPVGFVTDDRPPSAEMARGAAEATLGEEFVRQVDVVCSEVPRGATEQRRWIERNLLDRLKDHYRSHGLEVSWDESFFSWALNEERSTGSKDRLVRAIEDRLGEVLIPYLPAAGQQPTLVTVVAGTAGIQARPAGGTEASADHAKAS